ncbi:MAG: hypothetical protein ACM3X4_02110 [Ignavibacteriales bacterium]
MNGIDGLLTSRTASLLEEAKSLARDKSIAFRVMQDEVLLKTSAGAAATETPEEGIVIHLDPSRATEMAVAHELLHVIIHYSGWPQMYGMIGLDRIAKRFADAIDNTLDHHVFNPRLKEMGFDLDSYYQWRVKCLDDWPVADRTGPRLVVNAANILDTMLFGKAYREAAIRVLRIKQPSVVAMARKLEGLTQPARSRTRRGVRQAMVVTLDYLNRWMSEQTGQPALLRQRIGVSPVFSSDELARPAIELVELVSHQATVEDKNLWIVALQLRSDKVRFRTYLSYDEREPTDAKKDLQQRLASLTLRDLLQTESVRFGVL